MIFSKSMRHVQNPSDKNLDMIIIFSSLSFLSLTNEIHNYFRAITTLKNAFFQGFSMLHSKKWILRSKKSIFKNVWKSFLSMFGGQKTSSETQGVVLDPFRTIWSHLKHFYEKKIFNIFSNFFKHFLASKCSSWAKIAISTFFFKFL